MAISFNHYGAGLKNGVVKTSDGEEYNIDAIVSAEGSVEVEDIEVSGDDEVKSTFYYNRRESLTLEANAVSFDVIQAITGNTASSSAQGLEVPLGTDSENNPPYVEVRADTTARDSLGSNVTLKKTWHKVQIQSVQVSQSQGSEFNVSITGTAYQTADDIEGSALGSKRVATVEAEYQS